MHTGCMLRTTLGEPPSRCFGRQWQLSFVHPGKGICFNVTMPGFAPTRHSRGY